VTDRINCSDFEKLFLLVAVFLIFRLLTTPGPDAPSGQRPLPAIEADTTRMRPVCLLWFKQLTSPRQDQLPTGTRFVSDFPMTRAALVTVSPLA
jgi:hypothetical protein